MLMNWLRLLLKKIHVHANTDKCDYSVSQRGQWLLWMETHPQRLWAFTGKRSSDNVSRSLWFSPYFYSLFLKKFHWKKENEFCFFLNGLHCFTTPTNGERTSSSHMHRIDFWQLIPSSVKQSITENHAIVKNGSFVDFYPHLLPLLLMFFSNIAKV